MALTPLDVWTLCYVAVVTVALGAHLAVPPPHVGLLLLAHALLAGAAFAAPRARRAGEVGAFVGEFYPLIVDIALYTEVGLLNAAGGVSHDALVQRWEAALFSCQPSRDWIRAAPSPALSWALHAGYLSYYFVLTGAPLALWFGGRREAARRTLLLTMATFYICYSIFLVFPVAGPRYAFPPAGNAATATPIARFAQRLLDRGAAWGTAFPSSHVAVALVASISAGQAWRGLGACLVPAALLLTAGTVYGQFHYGVDALAGCALAAAVLALSPARPAARAKHDKIPG